MSDYNNLPDNDEFSNQLTTIELPHKAIQTVGHILEKAGFEVGSVGSGYCQMERMGAITEKEATDLKVQMADELFEFDIDSIGEDDD
jgi:hypothetical protein